MGDILACFEGVPGLKFEKFEKMKLMYVCPKISIRKIQNLKLPIIFPFKTVKTVAWLNYFIYYAFANTIAQSKISNFSNFI